MRSKHLKSKSNLSSKFHRPGAHPVSWAEIHKIVEKLKQEATDKLDDRVINIAEQIVIDEL